MLPVQGAWVGSLVGELRSHILSQACVPQLEKPTHYSEDPVQPKQMIENENIKQKQYCNKFNKDLKKKNNRLSHKFEHGHTYTPHTHAHTYACYSLATEHSHFYKVNI